MNLYSNDNRGAKKNNRYLEELYKQENGEKISEKENQNNLEFSNENNPQNNFEFNNENNTKNNLEFSNENNIQNNFQFNNQNNMKNNFEFNNNNNNVLFNKNSKKIPLIFVVIGMVLLVISIVVIITYGYFKRMKIKNAGGTDPKGSYEQTQSNPQSQTDDSTQQNSENNLQKYPTIYPTIEPKKPIIYLYPEKPTNVVVKLGNPQKLTTTYPKYNRELGWNVLANPDGTLVDNTTGRTLYSLYWEGKDSKNLNFDEGFIVKGSDTSDFLEEKLKKLGLNDKEAEEFIIYWLPKLESNEYNVIRFESMEEINKTMPLDFSVTPDTLIRVMMDFKGISAEEANNLKDKIKTQNLPETPERKGFVAVEWGGSEIN